MGLNNLPLRIVLSFGLRNSFSSLVCSTFCCLKHCSCFMIQELQYDQNNGIHFLEAFPDNVDVGTYVFVFEVPAC